MHPARFELHAGARDDALLGDEGQAHEITVHNHGAFIGSFWLSYDINGDGKRVKYPSGGFPQGASREMPVPRSATNVWLDFWVVPFPGQERWVTNKQVNDGSDACYVMWGTTYNTAVDVCD
jgi:hypothetical protein